MASTSASSDSQASLLAVSITVLSTSALFLVYSAAQLLRLRLHAKKLVRQQRERARASAAVGVNSGAAAAPVRLVGKRLFHWFVIASMLCKATAVVLELSGACDALADRVCWPLVETLYRVQNILLFLAYADTCLCWRTYLHSATALLYGVGWRRAPTEREQRRQRVWMVLGGVVLACATVVYAVLLFVTYDENDETVVTIVDTAAVTVVGVLYLVAAVVIAVQCARFIALTRRASRATTQSRIASRNGQLYVSLRSADPAEEPLLAGASAAPSSPSAESTTTAATSAVGGTESGSAGRSAAASEAQQTRQQKRRLVACFVLIIGCSVLLVARAAWPVVVWLFRTEQIAYTDWYNLGEHVLCEVIPLLCMYALVYPLPRVSVASVARSGIIVGTSVAVAPSAASSDGPASTTLSSASGEPAAQAAASVRVDEDDEDDEQSFQASNEASVNSAYSNIQLIEGGTDTEDDDEDDFAEEPRPRGT